MKSMIPMMTACVWLSAVLLPATSTAQSGLPQSGLPQLDREDADWIGERIFANECNLNSTCLTSWNEGEDFPSLGIGHFIWYREGQTERFQESFPDLLAFYDEQGVALPEWIDELPGRAAPWQSREQFYQAYDGPELTALRQFLEETADIQARFIIERLYASVPQILEATERPEAVRELFHAVAHSNPPHGMYALIDYVNFKGEGTAASEQYQGQGWGLLQVLEHMLDRPGQAPVLERFSRAARAVLRQRVANAPAERNEERWLQGWYNRAETYLPEAP